MEAAQDEGPVRVTNPAPASSLPAQDLSAAPLRPPPGWRVPVLVSVLGCLGAAVSLTVLPSPWPASVWLCLPVAAVAVRWGHAAALVTALLAAVAAALAAPAGALGLVVLAVLLVLGQSVAVLVRQAQDGDRQVISALDVQRREALEAAAERDALSLRLSHVAQHDILTGLPNRSRFLERLQELLQEKDGGPVGVLFVDLDDFKTVNDSLGHHAGDELLVGVGRRLQNALRDGDLVARFGGDEFAVLLAHGTEEQLAGVATRLLGVLRAPFALRAGMASGQGSGGLAIGRMDPDRPVDEQAGDFMRQADLAMYAAKASGGGSCTQFHAALQDAILERLALQDEITRALIQEDFVLAYQPVVDIDTGRLVSVEALVRWHHEERGDISPATFIPIAERSGAIVQLGLWVLEQACLDLRLWDELCPGNDVRLAVNVSARQLREASVGPQIARVLHRTKVDPRRLVLEVTESLLMDDDEAAAATLWQLRALGIRIAVDDFGTGYSSLSRLVDLPLDDLKIDRSFIAELDRSNAGATIVTAAIAMAHGLDLNVVAEGVETVEQRDFLLAAGCDQAQGFLFSQPVPSDAVVGLLRRGNGMTAPPRRMPAPRRDVPGSLPARPTPTVIPSLPRHR